MFVWRSVAVALVLLVILHVDLSGQRSLRDDVRVLVPEQFPHGSADLAVVRYPDPNRGPDLLLNAANLRPEVLAAGMRLVQMLRRQADSVNEEEVIVVPKVVPLRGRALPTPEREWAENVLGEVGRQPVGMLGLRAPSTGRSLLVRPFNIASAETPRR